MQKIILLLAFLLSLNAAQLIPLEAVNKQEVSVRAPATKIGQEAFIIRKNGELEVIGYECLCKSAQGGLATFTCEKIKTLSQDAMPSVSFEITKGDFLLLDPFSARGLLIAPSQEAYLNAKKQLADFELTHPDVFALELLKNNNPFPAKKDFAAICEQYYISRVIFALDDSATVVFCKSFKKDKILNLRRLSAQESVIKPFFHQLPQIKKGFFRFFGDKEIGDFNTYYNGLINANN
ncbi:MAG: plasminogen-binding N-terminal domain-containing protein [Helicobacteraceae bacterium]